MDNPTLINWQNSPQHNLPSAINALTTLNECLLASCNAVVYGDQTAASAINNHARGIVGSDGSAMDETMLEVIYANIRLSDMVHAAQAALDSVSTLPLPSVGYGTVVTRCNTLRLSLIHI